LEGIRRYLEEWCGVEEVLSSDSSLFAACDIIFMMSGAGGTGIMFINSSFFKDQD
jgi:hypothetical protein